MNSWRASAIESRVARIKARVAELTGNLDESKTLRASQRWTHCHALFSLLFLYYLSTKGHSHATSPKILHIHRRAPSLQIAFILHPVSSRSRSNLSLAASSPMHDIRKGILHRFGRKIPNHLSDMWQFFAPSHLFFQASFEPRYQAAFFFLFALIYKLSSTYSKLRICWLFGQTAYLDQLLFVWRGVSLAIVSYSKKSHDGSSTYIGTNVVGSNKLLIPSPEHCWFGGDIMWLVDIYTELLIRSILQHVSRHTSTCTNTEKSRKIVVFSDLIKEGRAR